MPVLGCRRAQRPLGEVAGLPVAGAICGQSRGSDDTGIRAGHRCADKRQVRFAGSRLHLGALKLAAEIRRRLVPAQLSALFRDPRAS